MPWLIERWVSGPAWRRVAMIAFVTGLVTVAARMSLIRPHHSHFSLLEADNKQVGQRNAELQRKVLQVSPSELHVRPSSLRAFSVAEFVGESRGKLLKWQPENKEGVLEILLPWEELPSLFTRLAEYRVVSGHSFTITAQGDLLKLVIKMEFSSES